MTSTEKRDEIRKQFHIENGIIRTPGRFEGEPEYMPWFWEVFLDGFAEEEEDGVLAVAVEPEDVEAWPVLKGRTDVRFYQRDDGFVCEV